MSAKSRNLAVRTAVAAVAIPALVYLFVRGGWWWTGFVEVLVLIAVWEMAGLFRRSERDFPVWIAVVLCPLPPVALLNGRVDLAVGWVLVVFFLMAWYAMRRPDPLSGRADVLGWIAAAVYIGLGFAFFVGVRQMGSHVEGARWLLFLFADLWVADTFAMLFGALWGKKKLAPIVSPNKTVVGFWAGLVGGALVGAVFSAGEWLPARPAVIVVGAVLLSAIGQLGDLYESLLKRRAQVKDISSIIPGHGGVLDRFDSALFAAPTLYLYLKLVIYR